MSSIFVLSLLLVLILFHYSFFLSIWSSSFSANTTSQKILYVSTLLNLSYSTVKLGNCKDADGWYIKNQQNFSLLGEYPFGTRYYSRVPVPNYCKRRPVGVRVREDSDFEEQHDSNPSLFSDLEISNETYSDIAANKWIAEHDMDQFQVRTVTVSFQVSRMFYIAIGKLFTLF